MSSPDKMQPASPRKHATVSSDVSSPSPSPSRQSSAPTNSQPRQSSSHVPQDTMYQAQPLKEAVSMAFDKSDVSHQISPDLIKLVTEHVTEQVMSNLKLNGLGAGRGNVPQQAPPAAAPSMTGSTPSIPPRDVYTPPSPDQDQLSNIGSAPSEMRASQTDAMNEKANSTARTAERLPTLNDDTQTPTPHNGQSVSPSPTILERSWRPLFEDGRPTPRLGQFLRGLALHIIEDFEPRNSLVITPQKMRRFYEQVRLTEEIYPWSDIFGGKMSPSSISHLYRDLNCQHHFVQRQFDEKPNIPALTPLGFQCWMTHIIQAHPEEEFMRLAKAAMEMPVSNADDRRERFPKQLSRRLFPKQSNRSVRELFEDSVLADPIIELPRHNSLSQSQPSLSGSERNAASVPPDSQMPPLPPQPFQPGPSARASHLAPNSVPPIERERKPYSASSSEVAVEDGNQGGSNIERERKPYSAAPGGGKMYESDTESKGSSRPKRANTTASSSKPPPPNDDELAKDPSRVRRPRRSSQSGPPPDIVRPRRMRSPSAKGQSTPYARSGGDPPPPSYPKANRASYVHDDSDNELDRTYSRESREERSRRRMTEDMPRPYMTQSYPTQPKPIFDPPGYQRQQPQDPSNGYGPSNGYPYPPPRFG